MEALAEHGLAGLSLRRRCLLFRLGRLLRRLRGRQHLPVPHYPDAGREGARVVLVAALVDRQVEPAFVALADLHLEGGPHEPGSVYALAAGVHAVVQQRQVGATHQGHEGNLWQEGRVPGVAPAVGSLGGASGVVDHTVRLDVEHVTGQQQHTRVLPRGELHARQVGPHVEHACRGGVGELHVLGAHRRLGFGGLLLRRQAYDSARTI